MPKRKLNGSALFNHTLKHRYGEGISMAAGIKRLTDDAEKRGIQKGVAYALTKLSLWERITGRVNPKK